MFFRAPIGTEEERNTGIIWPPGWTDATGYLNAKDPGYRFGIHTGADLNWNTPRFDADRLAPVYAIGDGTVTYAQPWPNVKFWGNIIVINHGMVDGKPLFSRYAHVANIRVSVGQFVRTGEQICQVGDGSTSLKDSKPLFPFHLHFDISTTNKLRDQPNNWPSPPKLPNADLVRQHYVEPREWLRQHFLPGNVVQDNKVIPGIAPRVVLTVWHVIDPAGVAVRKDAGMLGEQVGLLPHGATLSIDTKGRRQDGLQWGHIIEGQFNGFWVAIRKDDQSESFISTNPPR